MVFTVGISALSIAGLLASQGCALSKMFRPSYVTVGVQDRRDLMLADKGETMTIACDGSFWTDSEYSNVIHAAGQDKARTFPIEGLDFVRVHAGQSFCPPEWGLIASDTHNEAVLGVRFRPIGSMRQGRDGRRLTR